LSVHAVLEYLRSRGGLGKLLYFSSSKAFSVPFPTLVCEQTKRESTCIYSITKNAATDLIGYYRDRHGISANVLWTFNHESVRRGSDYFIPKIVDSLASALKNSRHKAEVFTLNFYADWSDAEELMELAICASDKGMSEDFIFASGETLLARDLVQSLFSEFGLNYKDHVVEKKSGDCVDPTWRADSRKMTCLLGRQPRVTIYETCLQILRSKYGLDAKGQSLVRD